MSPIDMLGIMLPTISVIAFSLPLIDLLVKKTRVLEALALAGSLFATVASILVFYEVKKAGEPVLYTYGGFLPHFGIVYEVDSFNALIGLFIAIGMLVIVVYSIWYRHHLDEPVWYYVLLLGLEIGMLGAVYTGDAFNLFVMLEVMSISAYGLVAYHKNSPEAVEAASKYALIGAVASTMYFTAVVILYAVYGSVNMGILSYMASMPATVIPVIPEGVRYATLFAVSMALWVFTFKSALFPSHFWLPDAHPEAPTPVSAALSGLLVNVGVYASARFLYTIFGPGGMLGEYSAVVFAALFTLGAISGVVAALMMMIQKDIKRLLAYSTVSHVGLIYMGISAGFLNNSLAIEYAITGAVLHILAHGLSKIALFFASGVYIDASATRNLDRMRGVGRAFPATSFAFTISFLNLAGLLPFLGFYSKFLITLGFIEGGFPVAALLVIIISALSIPGYLRAIYGVVFATGSVEGEVTKRWVEYLVLAVALSTLILGVVLSTFGNLLDIQSIASDLLNRDVYASTVLKKIMTMLRGWIR